LPGLVLCNLSAVVVAALGSVIEKELRISHTSLGAIQSGLFLGNAMGSVLFAPFVRRCGIKAAGLASMALLLFGNILSAIPLFLSILIGRVAMGSAISGVLLFSSSVAVHAFPARQNALLNVIHALLAGASGLGLMIVVPLSAALGGWWRVPMVLAAISLALLLAITLMRIAWTADSEGGNGDDEERISWLDGGLLRWVFLMFAYMLIETAAVLFYPVYAQEHAGVTPAAAARLAALFIAGIVAGRLVAAWLMKEKAGRWLAMGLVAGGGLLLLLSLVERLQPAVGALLFLGGFLVGPIMPLAVSQAVRHVGHSRNAVLSLMNFVCCVGGAGGAILAGWVGDSLGLQRALVLISLVFWISMLPLLGERNKK
jgi:predicted MFS family arabinose efflux permease